MDILAELRRALAEVRARMGGRKSQKKKKVRAPGRPAKTGRKTGCGTGAGGFGEGNDCAKEDGRPNVPKSFAQKGKQATAASLPATKEALIAKAATLEAAAKSAKISSARKKAAIRKKEKQAKESAEKQAADAARAKKRADTLQKIRIKKANDKVSVVGTPKSVADQLAEAKTAMKQKTAEASKQLTVAGTPKSIKQEIAEAKLQKAGEGLKIAGTPKSIKEELDELKARLAAKKEVAAQKPPQTEAAENHIGQQHLVKKNIADQGKLDQERDAVFGKDLHDGWKNYYGSGGEVAIQAKISLSIDKAKRIGKTGIKEQDIDDEMLSTVDPYMRYHGSADATQKLISQGVPKEYHRRYALSAGMADTWAATSGDSNPTAVGIQYAIKDEFGVAKPYTRHLKPEYNKAGFDEKVAKVRKNKAVRAVLRAQYEATQEWFHMQGIKKLTVVRGYSSSAKITAGGEQNVSMQPASSFSMSKGIAEKFAQEGGPAKARHLTATVDVSRVLSTARTGFGCLHEQELTILGGVIRGRVVNKSFDW